MRQDVGFWIPSALWPVLHDEQLQLAGPVDRQIAEGYQYAPSERQVVLCIAHAKENPRDVASCRILPA